ncbi:MAG TPA: thiamine-phosphate kinase [Acidimicrobiales bacterium]|nr:thiamine-phosphate kinase [Acidimicrobiales bacterium]
MGIQSGGERAAIERIRSVLPGPPAGETWIGDDAAVVPAPPESLLLTADLVVAGVHVDLHLVGIDDMGWKAMSANVSDIAAMAGRPLWALVSVAGPVGTDLDVLYAGVAAAAEHYRCPVVGGDLSSAETLVVSVAIAGTSDGRPPVLRSGASAGDALFVTGPLGASAAGLEALRSGRAGDAPELADAHRRPEARVAEGRAASAGGATAMIDVSDGLAIDVDRLAAASGVGVALAAVPTAEGATADQALGGGEDYELVFSAADPDAVAGAFAQAGLRPPHRIGVCTGDRTERSLDGRRLEPTGWEHDW